MPRIVIVGAGISGLSTAHYLQTAMPGAEIQVLEAASRAGGTIWTEYHEGFRVEIGANGFLDSKPSTWRLCEELGLRSRLVAASPQAAKRYLFWPDRLTPLPDSLLGLLWTPLLSWRGKWSLLSERFRRARPPLAEESIHAFFARRIGQEAAQLLADALVTGIHAGDAHLLSMPAAFPRLAELEAQTGSVFRSLKVLKRERKAAAHARGEKYHPGGRLRSFPEGLRVLIETLQKRLRRPILLGVRVRSINREESSWRINGEGRDAWNSDAVVLACPADRQGEILAELDPGLAAEVGAIAYSPAMVLALGYRAADVPRPLDGFGYVAPQSLRRNLLGVQWCSAVYPGRAPEGMVLLRAIAGGWNRADQLDWSDARLVDAIRTELKLSMGIEAAPVFSHLVRWRRAIPQYHLGHRQRVAAIMDRAARHPGLFLTGNAYYGVAMNDCTEQGAVTADRVARHLAAGRADPTGRST